MSELLKNEVIERLREYLRIPSVHPDIDYGECVSFLKRQASSLGLPVSVHEFVKGKPVVVITWAGLQPELPSILLNSHMDVVPVYEEHWTHPPFEAVIADDGFIYARGSQDMKSVGMMHLKAVRAVKHAGFRLKRTVHLSFVPDEEIGSEEGMEVFSHSEEFKRLNIGFGLDESMPWPTGVIQAFNGERTSRQIKITCTGEPGHGSMLADNTAGEKGGVQVNVLPENFSASFDIRIPPDVDHQEFEDKIKTWCLEAGNGVTFEYYKRNPEVKSTKIDGSVPFWTALEKAVSEMGYKINCVICPGSTDARYVRQQNIPCFGFSPLPNTPMLLHAHDERVHVDEYLRGIAVMETVLKAVANV